MFVCSDFSVFSFSLRSPPTSSLFPYTTLFRSSCARHGKRDFARAVDRQPIRSKPELEGRRLDQIGCRSTAQDRKSTRLNSSHGYISYAVFCLKKKKKI